MEKKLNISASPWSVFPHESGSFQIWDKFGNIVTWIQKENTPYGDEKADAHLIAAAPKLYDTVMDMGDAATDLMEQVDLSNFTDDKGHRLTDNKAFLDLVKAVQNAMSVLAQARGEG